MADVKEEEPSVPPGAAELVETIPQHKAETPVNKAVKEIEPDDVLVLVINNLDRDNPGKDQWQVAQLMKDMHKTLVTERTRLVDRTKVDDFFDKRSENAEVLRVVVVGNQFDLVKPEREGSTYSIVKHILEKRPNDAIEMYITIPADKADIEAIFKDLMKKDERIRLCVGMGSKGDMTEFVEGVVLNTIADTMRLAGGETQRVET